MVICVIYYYFFFSMVLCYLSLLRKDPLKGAFRLIGCCLFRIFFFCVFVYSWICYFLIMLFLSGVFFIIIYLARMSIKRDLRIFGGIWVFFVSIVFFLGFCGFMLYYDYGVVKYFMSGYVVYFFWVFIFLFYILMLVRVVFGSYGGALRSF
jgi:hypothetical protein